MFIGNFAVTRFISIHALREEGDQHIRIQLAQIKDFNPRPPRGGRRQIGGCPLPITEFQSTPSARRATQVVELASHDLEISIHALREEGDAGSFFLSESFGRFQSTPSARRATDLLLLRLLVPIISIHALREEGDRRR